MTIGATTGLYTIDHDFRLSSTAWGAPPSIIAPDANTLVNVTVSIGASLSVEAGSVRPSDPRCVFAQEDGGPALGWQWRRLMFNCMVLPQANPIDVNFTATDGGEFSLLKRVHAASRHMHMMLAWSTTICPSKV